jgi:hypothetical protein
VDNKIEGLAFCALDLWAWVLPVVTDLALFVTLAAFSWAWANIQFCNTFGAFCKIGCALILE